MPGPRGFYPNGIHVRYYNDVLPAQYFLDQPINWDTFTTFAAEGDVQTINFSWGTTSPAPGVNGMFWSARYEGQLLVPQNGTYVFYLDNLDDGGRLFIDGNTLIDRWLVQGPHFYSAEVPLTAGQHTIKIEYAQGPGHTGSISVFWELPSGFPKGINWVGVYSDKHTSSYNAHAYNSTSAFLWHHSSSARALVWLNRDLATSGQC